MARWNKALIAAFILAVLLPLLAAPFMRWDDAREKRKPAPVPVWGDDFPAQAERWFQDRFGFRERLIDLQSQIAYRLFDRAATRLVTVGRDGWLYFAGDHSNEDYQGQRVLTPEQLDRWRALIEARRAWAAARGIAYVFVLAANKQTIYPEHLPGYLMPGATTRARQFIAHMKDSPAAADIVYAAPILTAAKDQDTLFQQLDSHWNERGAYLIYRETMDRLSRQRPGLVTLAVGDFRIVPEPERDLATMMNLNLTGNGGRAAVFPERGCIRREDAAPPAGVAKPGAVPDVQSGCAEGRGRLLFFYDSFGHFLLPFLRASFAEMRSSFRHPTLAEIEAYAAAVQPDAIVEEWLERFLDQLP